MLTRLAVFLVAILAVLGGGTAWLAWRLVGILSLPAPWSTIGQGAVFGLALLILVGMFASRTAPKRRVTDAFAAVAFLGMALFSNLFVLVAIRDVVWLGLDLVGGVPALAGTLASFGRAAPSRVGVSVGIVAVAVGLVALGWWNARGTARVKDVEVPIDGLDEALDGFTFVQLTDVHVGPTFGGDRLAAVVDRVNELDADAVVLTGDLVDGSVDDLRSEVAPLARLKARYGSWFVTGNHEYYSGALAWIDEISELGVRVLLNEHVVLRHQGAALVLAGVTDYNAGSILPQHASDPTLALAGAPEGALRVLLAHQPRSAEAAAAVGVALQLSGHTHGGQFWPWMHLVWLQQPYTAGLHRLERTWVYVSRGTGYWGPPVRLGAPAEITRLRLRRA